MAYAENRCDKQQERAMEMHLMSCPLCAETVELYMAGNANEIKEIHDFVSQSINYQPVVKVVPLWKRLLPLAFAASLLLGFFFWKNNENQNTTAQVSEQVPQKTIVNYDSIAQENSKIAIVADDIQSSQKLQIEPTSTSKKSKVVTEDNALAYNEVEQKNTNIYSPVSDNIEMPTVRNSTPMPKTMDSAAESVSQKEDFLIEKLRLAQKAYVEQNYTKAIEEYKTILKTDANNQEALFFLGNSEIAIGAHQNALAPLERVASPVYYDEAQWELAQSYLKMNKLAKAKRILKILSEKENAFQTQAKILLERLGK
jgi:tetratricopeptide (TPR) repeat protein